MHAVIIWPFLCVFVYWILQSTEPGGHFICTVYVEEKKEVVEQSVQVTQISSYDTS